MNSFKIMLSYFTSGLLFLGVFELKYIATFNLVIALCFSSLSQSSCLNVSSATFQTEYPPNSNSQRISMFNNSQFYLCGPNTVVIDTSMTLESSCTKSVFINSDSKLVINSIKLFCVDPPSIYIKATSTLIIMPSSNSIVVYAETGALIVDQSNIAAITLTTCIDLPQAECNKVEIIKQDLDQQLISIYPNPTSDNLSIVFSGAISAKNISYSITDKLGQIVSDEILKNNIISTSALAPGLYSVHLKTQFGNVTKKFVKEK